MNHIKSWLCTIVWKKIFAMEEDLCCSRRPRLRPRWSIVLNVLASRKSRKNKNQKTALPGKLGCYFIIINPARSMWHGVSPVYRTMYPVRGHEGPASGRRKPFEPSRSQPMQALPAETRPSPASACPKITTKIRSEKSHRKTEKKTMHGSQLEVPRSHMKSGEKSTKNHEGTI